MTKYAPITIATLWMAVSPSASAEQPSRYLEADGLLVIEAESPLLPETIPGDWLVRDDLPDHTGESFIEWNGARNYPKSAAGDGTLTYPVRIVTAGVYEFRWRSRIARGEINTEHNDSWVRMPTGKNVEGEYPIDGWTKSHMSVLDAWTWNTGTGDGIGAKIRQHLDAGDHVIEISGRSTGHALDRLVLFDTGRRGFNSSQFDTEPVSVLIDDDGGAAGEDDTPTPAPADPIDLVAAGECSDGTLVLDPVADLDSDGATVNDADVLTVAGKRRAFLKFDLAGVPASTAATLRLSTLETDAEGALGLWLGGGSDWDEAGRTNLPDSVAALGEVNTPFLAGERRTVSMDPAMLASEQVTLVLEAGAGDAFELGARDADPMEHRPRLVLQGNGDFCDAWAAAPVDSGATDGGGDGEEGPGGDDTGTDVDGADPVTDATGDGDGTDPDDADPATDGTDTDEEGTAGGEDTDPAPGGDVTDNAADSVTDNATDNVTDNATGGGTVVVETGGTTDPGTGGNADEGTGGAPAATSGGGRSGGGAGGPLALLGLVLGGALRRRRRRA